ncbi:MAG: MFS transporter [Lachnospiraceae bacterium]|nr:MFS transporter [Lachnospiraceae bacterium]
MSDLRKQNAIIRVIFLMNMLGLSIGDAFNVVYVKRLAQRMVSADKVDLYVSMPITAMSAMMIAGVILSGFMLKHSKGLTGFMRVSSLITALGMIVRGLAFHYWILFLGFVIDGFGYGCIFIAIRYYAFCLKDDKDVLKSLIYVNGGAFAGQCMGTILGGILAEQIEYRTVYLIAAAILICAFLILNNMEISGNPEIGSPKKMLMVLKNKEALRFMVFLLVPIYMCCVFVSYTVPLDVDSYGFSSTVISGIMLIDYILAAYASPSMTTLVLSIMSSKKASLLYCTLIGVLIALYSVFRGLPFLIVVVVLFGLADSFGLSVVMDAYNKTRGKFEYSNNDALTMFIIMTRMGMTLAPGCILLFGNTLILSIIIMLGIVLYVFTSRSKLDRGYK